MNAGNGMTPVHPGEILREKLEAGREIAQRVTPRQTVA